MRKRAVVWVGVFAIALFSGSGIDRLRLGSAKLLSIPEVPESGDACERPVSPESASTSLFSAFDQPLVYAQEASRTVDVTRPPVRDILDTAPIYSSVGV